MKYTSAIMLTCLAQGVIQADCIDLQNSLIISPRIGSVVNQRSPVLIGIVKNTQQKPATKKPVILYIDNDIKVATVLTDNNGVWSYRLRRDQALENGTYHTLQAVIKNSPTSIFWAQGTMFLVDAENDFCVRTPGNVNTANSEINFPVSGGYVNTVTPTVVGTLLDAHFNPIGGETVTLYIDSNPIGSVTSNSNGVFSFSISSPLSNGLHSLSAYCVESSNNLSTISFTIDTTAPAVPVITTPSTLGVVPSTFTVTGTSEPYATVETFLDNDTYGQIVYADATGAWAIEYTTDLGVHTITARATDLAGNQSDLAPSRLFIVSL